MGYILLNRLYQNGKLRANVLRFLEINVDEKLFSFWLLEKEWFKTI